MLVIKDSKDPINSVSMLKCILIYSINQIKLSSFKEKIKEDGEFLELDTEAQTKMMAEIDRQSDSIPTTIPTAKNSFVCESPLYQGSIISSRNASLVSCASVNIQDDEPLTNDYPNFEL